jgi:carboxyl-terminal processing protease
MEVRHCVHSQAITVGASVYQHRPLDRGEAWHLMLWAIVLPGPRWQQYGYYIRLSQIRMSHRARERSLITLKKVQNTKGKTMRTCIVFTLTILLFSFNADAQRENTLSPEAKIYGLSKLWKEASYNFAFFDHVPSLNWDSCYQTFIPLVLTTRTDWEYYQVLQKFFVLLKDGHTRVFPPAALRNKQYGTATKAITTRLIQDKVIVTGVTDTTGELEGLKRGMEIVMIDNVDVRDYADKYVAPYMYASTPQDLTLQTYGHFLLSGSVTKPATIEVKNFNGEMKEYNVRREPWLIEEEVFKEVSMVYKELPHNVGYVKINNFFGDKFTTMFDSQYTKILQTDGLIIDIRGNVGGSTELGYYVLKHFTSEKFEAVNWKSPMHVAAHKSWKTNKDWFEQEGGHIYPHADRIIYAKPIDVIIDEGTFSGGEDFCAGFVIMKRGKLIGRKTAGSTGNPLILQLPGGGFAMICTKRDIFPDGKEFVGYGIEPDIAVDVTIEDIRNGNDRALNVAIDDILDR